MSNEDSKVATWPEVMDFAEEYASAYRDQIADGEDETGPDLTIAGVAAWCVLLIRGEHPEGLPYEDYRKVVSGYIDAHINGTFTPDDTLPTSQFPLEVPDEILHHPKISPAVSQILRERGLSGPRVNLREQE